MLKDYQKQWQFLKNKFEAGQLRHAYLLSGNEKTEKKFLFAKELIKLVNCLPFQALAKEGQVKEKPCYVCQNCKMVEKEIFLDLMIIKSQDSESSMKNRKDMLKIEISQIRTVQNFLNYKPYYGNFKAVIIENAERMTLEAQNCFLKSLEEPKGRTIIFLISSKSELLLPTIFSRCQEIKFLTNSGTLEENSEEKEILKDLPKVISSDLAEKFSYVKAVNLDGDNFNKILNAFQKYFRNLLLMKIGVSKGNLKDNNIYSIVRLKKIIRLIDSISFKLNISNINNKLALEILLLEI